MSDSESYGPPSDPASVKKLIIEMAGYAQSLVDENVDLRRRLLGYERRELEQGQQLSQSQSQSRLQSSYMETSADGDGDSISTPRLSNMLMIHTAAGETLPLTSSISSTSSSGVVTVPLNPSSSSSPLPPPPPPPPPTTTTTTTTIGTLNTTTTTVQVPPGSYLDIDFHAIDGLSEHMQNLKIDNHNKSGSASATQDRFFGGSSSVTLLKTAIDLKHELSRGAGDDDEDDPSSPSIIPESGSGSNSANHGFLPSERHLVTSGRTTNGAYGNGNKPFQRRPEFWAIHPWQLTPTHTQPLLFPPQDLLDSLVSLYFSNYQYILPDSTWTVIFEIGKGG
ncbi:hypothetical protein D9757_007807 [Collybiopsis confluens]|uniref:Uncharacterized protein n=1 Tax=Collybiopsis confluens TaxID=2823264 RepID=A0A8H5HQM0_9AGAR|nr:hypothetical protein D9757_007807 [Collybiopsis confluens]